MTYIHPTAIIGEFVTIEDNCYIGPYCIIGFPAEWKRKEHNGCGVLIKSGSRLTGLVTVDSGVEQMTIIGNDCYLMKHSHVGHDAVIKDNVTISCGAKIAVIHQKVKVPEGCMIGAAGFVGKKSVLDTYCKYAGVPVKYIGINNIR